MARPTLRECNRFFFDCETGGLSPFVADMVQVACVVTDPSGVNIIDQYEAKVIPKKPVDAKAASINGYNAEKWAAEGAVELDVALFRMLSMARNSTFVAHNVAFDWGFFELALAKRNQRWPGDYHRICTVALSLPLLQAGKVPNQKLTTLSEYFGVKHDAAHDAMSDVEACRGVYVKLMEVYEPLFAKLPESTSTSPAEIVPETEEKRNA